MQRRDRPSDEDFWMCENLLVKEVKKAKDEQKKASEARDN